MKLITETSFDFEITESKGSKDMYVVGIFSSAGVKNNNGRIYDKKILEREINKIQEKVKSKSLFGELSHPESPGINPDKIAILTTQLEWKGNDVYGRSKILDTPMGNIAKTLIKEGRMGISSRGLGTVNESGHVNEDFNLLTWDLVTEPSNQTSWINGIYEGKEFGVNKEPEKEIITNLDALNNFASMDINLLGKVLKEEVKDIDKEVMGLMKWMDDFHKAYKAGNMKLAQKTLDMIMNRIKLLKVNI